MRVSREGRGLLTLKYAGQEFAVFDMKSKRVLGPWTQAVGAAYSARDEAASMTNDESRFMVKRRIAA